MARIDIYLPDQLKCAMEEATANWSRVAQMAFETTIAQAALLKAADKDLADWEVKYRAFPVGLKHVQSARRQIQQRLEEFGSNDQR